MKVLLFSLALLAFGQVLQAQNCPDDEVGLIPWSTYVTAGAGDLVTIPPNARILFDMTTTPIYFGVEIWGTVIFDDTKDLSLQARYVAVLTGGELFIGAACCPFQHKVLIQLYSENNKTASKWNVGTKSIGAVAGAKVEVHGVVRTPTWTKLSQNAAVGATSITLMENVNWIVGDQIVLVSTDFVMNQAEQVTITSVNGNTINFSPALQYSHFGSISTDGVDMRGEVGLLTRNIKLTCNDSTSDGFGVHFMFRDDVISARLTGVEVEHGGQSGVLGRYPIHFHIAKDMTGRGWVRESSIHHTHQRCLTVHSTDGLDIRGNVAYLAQGHCFFIEDGNERNNNFSYNLGINSFQLTDSNPVQLLPSDNTPAVFWITNPQNNFVGNVAAGSDGFGYWYALPDYPTGPSYTTTITPIKAPMGIFLSNTAHSIDDDGLMVDEGPEPPSLDTTNQQGYVGLRVPTGNTRADIIESVFEGYTAYKCKNRGAWFRGNYLTLKGATFSDNAIGVTFAFGPFKFINGRAVDTLFVGESENIGNPTGGAPRTYPKNSDYPIRGFELYDGPVSMENVRFAKFIPSAVRNASGISMLREDPFPIFPVSDAKQVRVLDGSLLVYFQDFIDDGDKNVAFRDLDGTVTGRPPTGDLMAIVVNRDPFYTTPNCVQKPEWLAQICPNHFAQLSIINDAAGTTNGWTNNPYAVTVTREDTGATRYLCSGNCPKPTNSHPNTHLTTIMMRKSYIVRWEHSSPSSLTLRLGFASRFADSANTTTNWIVIGICYPFTASVSTLGYDGRNGPTQATSLAAMRTNVYNSSAKGDGLWYRDTVSGIIYFKIVPSSIRNSLTVTDRDPQVSISLDMNNAGNARMPCATPAADTYVETDPQLPPVATAPTPPAFGGLSTAGPRYVTITCNPDPTPTNSTGGGFEFTTGVTGTGGITVNGGTSSGEENFAVKLAPFVLIFALLWF